MATRKKSRSKGGIRSKIANIEKAATMPVLAVDPALTSGWALYIGGELVSSGVIKGVECLGGYNAPSAPGIYRAFGDAMREAGKLLVVVEMQYPRPVAQEALMREVEARAYWEFLAHLYGCIVARVFPTTWQSVEGISGERKERKSEAIRLAGVSNDNEADAILLGRYALRMARIRIGARCAVTTEADNVSNKIDTCDSVEILSGMSGKGNKKPGGRSGRSILARRN